MIKIKYADLNNRELVESFVTIKKSALPVKAAYRFNRIADLLDGKINDFQKRYQTYLKDYAKKDDEGKFIPVKNADGVTVGIEMADKEAANTVLNELLSEEISIEVRKVDASDLENIMISPNTLAHLEPFIEGLDA